MTTDLPIAARCLLRQASAISEDAAQLRALAARIGKPGDLPLPQWAHLYALCLELAPDLVIELGREAGNSTCALTQAAQRLGDTAVHSFCLSPRWDPRRVADLVTPAWLARLTIHTGDLTEVDFAPLVSGATGVLVLWDAHGLDVADHVLGHLLPLLARTEHLIVCHDLDDNRVINEPREYGGRAFWRGGDDYLAHQDARAPANLGWTCTRVDEAIPILDFCWRNRLPLRSAGLELRELRAQRPEEHRTMTAALPADLCDPDDACHWSYFSLAEAEGPLSFPAPVAGYRTPAQRRVAQAEEIARLQAAADEQRREIAWRTRAAADLEQRLAAAQEAQARERAWREGEAAALREQIAALRSERQAYERQARAALAAAEQELRALRASLSWRATGLARTLLERLDLAAWLRRRGPEA